jgi:hypothetical protein
MSRVTRGPATIKRTHAKNYIQREAQKRLNETVAPFNTQTHNALAVNAVEVDLYQIQDRTGYPCSCEKTEHLPQYENIPNSNVPPVVPTQNNDSSEGVKIRLKDNDLFGDSRAEHIMDALEFDVSGEDHPFTSNDKTSKEPEGNVDYEDGLFLGNNIQCGICYRAGFQPGYKAWGKQRHVLTHKDIETAVDYWVDTTKSPHIIRKQVQTTKPFVEFKIMVPKYFSHLVFSVRNNEKLIQGEKLYDEFNEQLTLGHFKTHAGQVITVRTRAKEFTHVVVEFDLGNQKLVANIGGESQTLDYSMLETIGNMSVVLPPSVNEIKSNDVLIIKKRRLALKIIDKERKITSDQRRLEWMVQTRVLQPTEALKYIAEGFKLL